MDNVVDALQGAHGLRTKEAVGVGDDAEERLGATGHRNAT
jgi:hypothetical protein